MNNSFENLSLFSFQKQIPNLTFDLFLPPINSKKNRLPIANLKMEISSLFLFPTSSKSSIRIKIRIVILHTNFRGGMFFVVSISKVKNTFYSRIDLKIPNLLFN